MVNVVVCTNLSGKELHRQVGVGRVLASGCLGGVMVSTLARDIRGMLSTRAMLVISIPLMTLFNVGQLLVFFVF